MELLPTFLNLLRFFSELALATAISAAGLTVFSVLAIFIRDFVLFPDEAVSTITARIKGPPRSPAKVVCLALLIQPPGTAQRLHPHLTSACLFVICNPESEVLNGALLAHIPETFSIYVFACDALGQPTLIRTTGFTYPTEKAALRALDRELKNGKAVVIDRAGLAGGEQ
jgi:hypothetical protein